MEKIKAMVDAVVAADTLADRQTTAKNLLVAIEAKFKVSLTEAKHHIEKASAAPVPDADAPVFKGGPQAPPVPVVAEAIPVGFMGTPLGPAPIVALSAANKPVPENL